MNQATATQQPSTSKAEETKQKQTKQIQAPATMYAVEKPVPSTQPKQYQFVVTIDGQSGAWTKIEKLDEASGARTELSNEEYAMAMYSHWLALASPYYYSALMSAYYY
jgi:hypothetical protein